MLPEQNKPCFSKDTLRSDGHVLEWELYRGMGHLRFGFISKEHPQEAGVVGRLRTAINRCIVTGTLKHSHLRVFRTCPEYSETRFMRDGKDLNRQFVEPGVVPVHPKARLLHDVFTQFPIEYVFSFHEDHEVDLPHLPFYFYDIPHHTDDPIMEELVDGLRHTLIGSMGKAGFAVYSGPDDPELSDLFVTDGYLQTVAQDHYDKTFETYMAWRGCRSFVFDIPGFIPIWEKQKHVDLVVERFVLPFIEAALPLE